MANERARRLRSNMTDAEKQLWWRLRMLKRDGFHFRRQVPINHLIVDFACYSARLVVEVDGGQHNWDEGVRRDRARDAHLRSQGFRVLRFWNNDVLSNTDGVEEIICDALTRGTPTPNPSPQGGGASEGHRLARNSTQ
jgi:very-short-patch-repair endonuclease